jgi:DNA-directed RNA polymerase I subunit RPA2
MRCRRCSTRVDRTSSVENGDVWEDGTGKRFIGGGNTTTVAVPFVLKYLDSELAAMGISMKYHVEPQ